MGGHCPKQCGKVHADLFGLDGCTFNNALTQDEKDEHKVKLDKYLQAKNSSNKEEKEKAVKPQTILNEAQKRSIKDRVKELIELADGKEAICLMC